MRNKTFIVLMAGFILMTLLGCTPKDEDDSTFTFSVLYNEAEDVPFQEDWEILDEYYNRKNVTLNIRTGDNENFEEAIDLNINTESPPDVLLKCWPDTIEGYANEGLILPISDYIDLMPHYRAYIEENDLEEEIEKLKLANGKYYILPGYQREVQVQQWIYRKDIFDENNIPAPTTYNELYESLLILKGLYPESTPITASWGGAHLMSMMGANYGIPAGWSGTRYFDDTTSEWKYAPATNAYRELHRFLNRSYTNGILDPALFTQSNEDFIEKIVNGSALVTVTWISSGFATWNEQLSANGFPNGEWAPLPVMESTVGISALPPVEQFRKGLAISNNAATKPYFEDMIEFLDWAIYSEEGINLTYWGVEGLTYETTPHGKAFLSHIKTPSNPDGTMNLADYGFNTLFNLNEDSAFEDNKKPDDIVTFLNRSEEANETLPSNPNLILSYNDINITEVINQDLALYVDEASKKFITGEWSIEDDWDDYIAEIDDFGYPVLETVWNTAWEIQNE